MLAVGLGAALLVFYLRADLNQARLGDLQVYRGAVQALLAGQDLYGFEIYLNGFRLPFTYPPFAALVMLPLALLPDEAVIGIVLVGQFLLLGLVTYLLSLRTPLTRRGWKSERLLALALGFLALAWTDPVMHGVALGQVALLLVALVLVDFVLVPPRWRGVLTGLAAAIKLTPLVFVGYLLITKQWRQAANAIGAFAGATALGFLLLPRESLSYWTGLLWQTDRVGEASATRNKSLFGLLHHVGVGEGVQPALWLALVVVISAAGLLRARRHLRSGEETAAVLVVGMLSAVISPISWTHHLVWLPLAGLYLAFRGGSLPRLLGWFLLLICWVQMPTILYQSSGQLWLDVIGDTVVVVAILISVFGLPGSGRTGETPLTVRNTHADAIVESSELNFHHRVHDQEKEA